jgi:hypothetical protein
LSSTYNPPSLPTQVRLRRPIPVANVEVTEPWLHVQPGHGLPQDDVLLVTVDSPSVVGDHDARLLLPVASTLFQLVPVLVRARAPEQLHPERVILSLPKGARLEYPVRLTGTDLRIPTEFASWSHDLPLLDHPHAGLATFAIRVLDFDKSTRPLHPPHAYAFVLELLAGNAPGLFTGQALIRPRHDSHYALPLPYAVRVTDTPEPLSTPGDSR